MPTLLSLIPAEKVAIMTTGGFQFLMGIYNSTKSCCYHVHVCGQTRWLFEFANSIVHVDFIVNRCFTIYISGYTVEMELLEHQLHPPS